MMRRLVVTPTAEAELLDAAQWYHDRREGLGVDFLLHLEAAFDAAQRRPNSFPRAHGELRRVLLKRFPYAAYFRVDSKTVRVVAVRHTSRRNRDLEDES
jgi:plasmid stabilization system protein ParE